MLVTYQIFEFFVQKHYITIVLEFLSLQSYNKFV